MTFSGDAMYLYHASLSFHKDLDAFFESHVDDFTAITCDALPN